MLGLLGLFINGLAALRIHNNWLDILAILSTVVSYFSWQVIKKFEDEPAPPVYDYSIKANMLSFFVGVILLGMSFL
ncbi:hypothetical protein HGB07_10075 [Candidatus Roizmanbacteria bacterium]|nr:hypothetical protein [Candidatus Roizmanbacteria bacterium]